MQAPLYVVHVPDDDTVLAQRGQHGAAQQRLRSMYMTLTMKTDPEVPVDTGGQPQAERPDLSRAKRILVCCPTAQQGGLAAYMSPTDMGGTAAADVHGSTPLSRTDRPACHSMVRPVHM